eukprot:gene3462-4452_t
MHDQTGALQQVVSQFRLAEGHGHAPVRPPVRALLERRAA